MKKLLYFLGFISVFALQSCVSTTEDDYYVDPGTQYPGYFTINGYRYPIQTAEIYYVGQDANGFNEFEFALSDGRVLNTGNSYVNNFLKMHLYTTSAYYTPENYYRFGGVNDIDYVSYAEDANISWNNISAGYFVNNFSFAEMDIIYESNRIYRVEGRFRTNAGLDITIYYRGLIRDLTDGSGTPLAVNPDKIKPIKK